MRYDVIINKCDDPARAAVIARRIAGWSGMTPEMVYAVITEKTACIRKGTDEVTARKVMAEYEKLGARIELRTVIENPGTGGQVLPDDEDDDGPSGRVLSDAEYVAKVNQREDIFYFEGGKRLRNAELVALLCAFAAGAFLSTRTFTAAAVNNDFFEKGGHEKAIVVAGPVDRPHQAETAVPQVSERRVLKPAQQQGHGGVTGGGGNPRERVTKQGVLGIVAGAIKGKTVASADIFGKGGFASEIDALLSGMQGLKSGGSGGVGRRTESGMGFGTGYGSGYGGGSGGIGDLVDNLMSSGSTGLALRGRGKLVIATPTFAHGGAIVSGRSKKSILQVVMQNLSVLRYAYNKRLREKPGLKGKVTVRFAIDEFGKVLFCSVAESTMGDDELETLIIGKIKSWKFDKIDKVGDVTEVVYPFVFSQ